jgi:DNA-binding transcriptional ArsR family regulator
MHDTNDRELQNDPMVSINTPDYEIAENVDMSTAAQLQAYANPLRMTLLDLLLERAATVTELAEAVARPRSTVAHHVNVLGDAGLVRMVRTRRVRAIDERFFGRTGRTIHTVIRRRPGDIDTPALMNELSVAAAESIPAHEADERTTAMVSRTAAGR